MIIGVPREVKAEEHRVGLLPSAVYQLTQRGHRVLLGTGAYARTATQALANVTFPYVDLIATRGLAEAAAAKPELLGGINVMNGQVTCPAVAEAHGMECSEVVL